jgi:hypothetical protein
VGNAVVNRRDEVRGGERGTLRIGDRDQRHIVDRSMERPQIGDIQAAMQSRQYPRGYRPKDREVEVVDVKMKDVEFARALPHLIEHHHVMRIRIANGRVKSQRLWRARDQLGRGYGIAACKQGDTMTLAYQLFGQI